MAAATELAGLGETLDDTELVLHAARPRCTTSSSWAAPRRCRPRSDKRDRLAEELRHPYYLWSVIVTRAMDAANAGRFSEAELAAAGALHYRVEADVQQAFTVHSAQFLQVLWLQGRWGEPTPTGCAGRAGTPSRTGLSTCSGVDGGGAGRLDDAAVHLEALLAKGLDQLPRDIEWFVAMAALADACERRGAPRQGRRPALRHAPSLRSAELRRGPVGLLRGGRPLARHPGRRARPARRRRAPPAGAGLARHESMAAPPPFIARSQAALSSRLANP